MENIQLKKSDSVLKFGILDEEGKETGEFITFDVEDIELPLKLAEAEEKHKANLRDIKVQLIIIDKKQDEKGDGILSKNEREKYNALKEFYKREEETLDLFLGEGGTKKLLNGRNPYYTMYDDINEMLKPILPKLTKTTDDVIKSIKTKYKLEEKTEGVLEVDDQ